jgi:beta-lactam-binding protein with PASTA domain
MKILPFVKKYKKILRPLGVGMVIVVLLLLLIDNVVMPYYVQKGKVTKVPDVIGLSLQDAKTKLAEAGLIPKEAEYKNDKRYPIGSVIVQIPAPASEVKFGRGIYLTISGGEELVEVPNLRGKSIREATFNLERRGLKMGNVSYEASDEIFPNTIIRQSPSFNSKVKEGTYIDVVVSQGQSTNTRLMPDVSMKTLNEAEKIIIDAGFKIGKITYRTNLDLLPNTILEQNPHAGDLVQLDQPVDLIIAQKEEQKSKDEN